MKSIFSILAIQTFSIFPLLAILDTNTNGLSDVWEKQYNNDSYFNNTNPSHLPISDPDQDGWTNAQEALAGTNPFSADGADGKTAVTITPTEITHTHELSWPVIPGKNYRVQASSNLSFWVNIGPIINAAEYDFSHTITMQAIDPDAPNSTAPPPRLFYRVKVMDSDQDFDGLSSSEEYALGLNPSLASTLSGVSDQWLVTFYFDDLINKQFTSVAANPDSDGDGMNHAQEQAAGTNPTQADTDGDGIPDGSDLAPLSSALSITDRDGDGIPDDVDPMLNLPRGEAPSILADNAVGNPTCNFIKGDIVKFLITVNNPAGDLPSAANLSLSVNGVQENATFTPHGVSFRTMQSFVLTWVAKTATGYPDKFMQNLVVRFTDGQNATASLKLASIDVAEWQGTVASFRTGSAADFPYINLFCHSNGKKFPSLYFMGSRSGSPGWYRGPSNVSFLDGMTGSLKMKGQIPEGMRYPLFLIADGVQSTPVVEEVLSLASGVQYPHHGLFLFNRSETNVLYTLNPGGVCQANGGTRNFLPLPERTNGDNGISTIKIEYFKNGEWMQQTASSVPRYTTESLGRRFWFDLLYTEQSWTGYGSRDSELFALVDSQIIPHGAGTLEYPGLPLPVDCTTLTINPAWLAMKQDTWHKVVLKVGMDSVAFSNGIGLWIRRGTDGETNPQVGFMIKAQLANQTFQDIAVPSDGKVVIAENSPLWEQLTSPSGLNIFISRNETVKEPHEVSLQLLKKREWHENEAKRMCYFQIAPCDVAVDTNRDTQITFDTNDATSAKTPYRFWINDDRDELKLVDPLPEPLGHNGDYEEDDYSADILKDHEMLGLECRRDLEDLTRMWINFSGLEHFFSSNEAKVELKVRSHSGALLPHITLFQAVEADGGREYLKNEAVGGNQISQQYKEELCRLDRAESVTVSPRAWANLPPNKIVYLLFEGAQVGDGQIIFEIWKDNKKLCDLPPVVMRLKKAVDFYETWTVGDATSPEITNENNNYSLWPATSAQMKRNTGGDLFTPQTSEEKDYIMFVHGWNMSPDDKTQFADTMYKRLWHQGFKGRFGAYRWPTFFTDGIEVNNFNASEERAWNSAAPLAALLQNRATIFHVGGQSKVRIFGHSMGNIVCSESLRQLAPVAPVHTYISGQAALAAHCWDARDEAGEGPREMNLGIQNSGTANVYRGYWQAAAGNDAPHKWLIDGRPSYMHSSYMPSNVTYVNHYNKDDWALSSWELNQKLKPSIGYDYGHVTGRPTTSEHQFFKNILNPTVLYCPNDRYHIFSWAAEARSYATGAEGKTGGMFDPLNSVNLNAAPINFDHMHKGHSAQFRSNIQKRWPYWEQFLDDNSISTTP